MAGLVAVLRCGTAARPALGQCVCVRASCYRTGKANGVGHALSASSILRAVRLGSGVWREVSGQGCGLLGLGVRQAILRIVCCRSGRTVRRWRRWETRPVSTADVLQVATAFVGLLVAIPGSWVAIMALREERLKRLTDDRRAAPFAEGTEHSAKRTAPFPVLSSSTLTPEARAHYASFSARLVTEWRRVRMRVLTFLVSTLTGGIYTFVSIRVLANATQQLVGSVVILIIVSTIGVFVYVWPFRYTPVLTAASGGLAGGALIVTYIALTSLFSG